MNVNDVLREVPKATLSVGTGILQGIAKSILEAGSLPLDAIALAKGKEPMETIDVPAVGKVSTLARQAIDIDKAGGETALSKASGVANAIGKFSGGTAMASGIYDVLAKNLLTEQVSTDNAILPIVSSIFKKKEKPIPSEEEKPIQLQKFVPEKFKEMVFKNADKFGNDPKTLASVIMQESSFNPLEVNEANKDDSGLGQHNKSTREYINKKYWIPTYGKEYDVFNAEQNMEATSWYLSDLVKRAEGDNDLAIKAYKEGMKGSQGFGEKGKQGIIDAEDYLKKIKKLYSEQ